MTAKPRERVKVAYPGYDISTLNVIIANLHSAQCGNVNMQRYIAWQFFKAHGFNEPPHWDWGHFGFTLTGEAGRPPRHAKNAQVETYGCTCVRDCASCDQGWHNSCTAYCQFGQSIVPQ